MKSFLNSLVLLVLLMYDQLSKNQVVDKELVSSLIVVPKELGEIT